MKHTGHLFFETSWQLEVYVSIEEPIAAERRSHKIFIAYANFHAGEIQGV
jgi:hypothetical protein